MAILIKWNKSPVTRTCDACGEITDEVYYPILHQYRMSPATRRELSKDLCEACFIRALKREAVEVTALINGSGDRRVTKNR